MFIASFRRLGSLELKVTVINMNDPSNKATIKTCKLLSEYCIFVNKLVHYHKKMTEDAAMKKAVDVCIRQNVLKEFLLKHRKELYMGTMLVKEWDWNMAVKVASRENFEMGLEKGEARGLKKGVSLGRKEGVSLGRKEGIGLGLKKGVNLGRKEGVSLGMEKVVSLIEQGVSLGDIKKMLSKGRTPKRKLTPRSAR